MRRTFDALAVPAAVWLAATATVLATAAERGYAPLAPATWKRWDSGLYLWIAQDGYWLGAPCRGQAGYCGGNTGWFPGYPWLVRLAHDDLGLAYTTAGVCVSWTFGLATLVLLWVTFLGRRRSAPAIGALAFAAFSPGAVYRYAVFPLSVLAFCTVAYLWLLHRRRWLPAGVAGGLAAVTYPTAAALAAVGAAWGLATARADSRPRRLARALLAGGLPACGTALAFAVMDRDVGRWDAYFLAQRKYHHHLQAPLMPAVHALGVLIHRPLGSASAATAFQTLLVTVVLVTLVWAAARGRPLAGPDGLLLLWAVVAWVAANVESGVSTYRAEATLLPLALLVRRLPVPLVGAFTAAAAAVVVWTTALFLDLTLL